MLRAEATLVQFQPLGAYSFITGAVKLSFGLLVELVLGPLPIFNSNGSNSTLLLAIIPAAEPPSITNPSKNSYFSDLLRPLDHLNQPL